MKSDKKSFLLYVVTDRTWTGKQTLYEQTEAAVKGGAGMVQIREKELDADKFYAEAKEIKELCRIYNVPFIVNDDVELAKRIDADGVHVGQSDMDAAEVRRLIGNDKILGVSVQTAEQAICAEKCGADYLGVGAIFSTSTKADADAVSIDTLKEICNSVKIPVVAIGGISVDNVSKLSGSGISGVAVISAVYAAENIEKAARDLKNEAEKAVLK